jgi:NADP-dependent 3-hydroxy acid dehydrogenase YdfG
MSNYIQDKVSIITGAAGGFGRLITLKAAALGARVVAADIHAQGLQETQSLVAAAGGLIEKLVTDVRDLTPMTALTAHAVESFGAIDVMVNNAGVMPLAFYADHAKASAAWDRCIDINFKGVLHGITVSDA